MTSAIEEYNDVLQSGKIKACKKLKAVYQHLTKNINHPGKYHFDQKTADRAVTFIERFCCIPKMRGTPRFKLELWQKALVEATFGFVDDQNLRQYREVFLFIGRKNAKSILAQLWPFICCWLTEKMDRKSIRQRRTDHRRKLSGNTPFR